MNRTNTLAIGVTLFAAWILIGSLAWTGAALLGESDARVGSVEATSVGSRDAAELADPSAHSLHPLSPEAEFRRVVVGGDGTTAARVGDDASTLVYRNNLGRFLFAPPPAGAQVADDVTTTASIGCNLDRYVFRVSGDVRGDGSGQGPFSVDFALYEACPGAQSNPLPIPGTDGHADFPDNGFYEVEFEVPPEYEAPLPSSFYLGVLFSRPDAAVVVGAPPTLGFSVDGFGVPGLPCVTHFGQFPDAPHASMYAEVYVRGECPAAFVGYKNTDHAAASFTPGAHVYFADDITLGIEECNLIAYDIAYKGTGIVSAALRTHLDRSDPAGGGVIPGTHGGFLGFQLGQNVNVGHLDVDPPIRLPTSFWVVFRTTTFRNGPVLTCKETDLGGTSDFFMVYDENTAVWEPWEGAPQCWGGFDVTLYCEGAPPVGACCDMVLTDDEGEAVCRELPEMNCPFPAMWREGAACESVCIGGEKDGEACTRQADCPGGGCPGPFDGQCGLSACCTVDGQCADLTPNECGSVPPTDAVRQYEEGRFCGLRRQRCPVGTCLDVRLGWCGEPHEALCRGGTQDGQPCDPFAPCAASPCCLDGGVCEGAPGCFGVDCCTAVCTLPDHAFCCEIHWDEACAVAAIDLCAPRPPNDECYSPRADEGALLIAAAGLTVGNLIGATESASDPGFCCREDDPGATGVGTTWYKFTAPPALSDEDPFSSVKLSTCSTANGPARSADDTLLQVFASLDADRGLCADLSACSVSAQDCAAGSQCVFDEQAACETLAPVACNDNAADSCVSGGAPRPDNAAVCARNLVPGRTYYVMVAAKSDANRGSFTLLVTPRCDPVSSPGRPDCDGDGMPDLCELPPFEPAGDCDGNGVPDECELDDPEEVAKVTPAEPVYGGRYGYSVSIDDGRAVVGAPDHPSYLSAPGSAYVLRYTGDTWVEEAELIPDVRGEGDLFGISVASDGAKALVGSSYSGAVWPPTPGSAYVFRREGDVWVQEARLSASDGEASDLFGTAVAIDGRVAVVGRLFDEKAPDDTGSAYVFRFDGGTWREEQRLTPSGPRMYQAFGAAVAVADDTVLIGAPLSASVYVFEFVDGLWVEMARLIPVNPDAYDRFGASLDISGDRVVVGTSFLAPMNLSSSLVAYVFRRDGVEWIEEAQLFGAGPPQSEWFGASVSIDGDLIVAGAPAYEHDGYWEGIAYLYRFDGQTWRRSGTFLGSDVDERHTFGWSVALSGSTVLIGAPGDGGLEPMSGSAYFFDSRGNDCNDNRIHDACETDGDADGTIDGCDNCPGEPNPVQADRDRDGVGDTCDACTDADGDGLGDPGFPMNTCPEDDCPEGHNDLDADGDDTPDGCDLCPLDPDDDSDGDELCGDADNCPGHYNPGQGDCDDDGVGDACVIAGCKGDRECDDCNVDGVPDGCEQDNDHNADGIIDDCDSYWAAFEEVETVNTREYYPQAIATGDFDEDGFIDFAAAGYEEFFGDFGLAVYRNRGDATFERVFSTHTYWARDIISADLDDDGDLDLAFADLSGDVVMIFNRGRPPSYGRWLNFDYQNSRSIDTFAEANSLAAHDFDGDGALDLVVTLGSLFSPDGFLAVYENGGWANYSLHSSYRVGGTARSVTLVDLDNDSDLDAVTSNQTTNDVSVLINRGVDILGRWSGFDQERRFESSSLPDPQTFWSAAGDVDGDGDEDVVVANPVGGQQGTVAVLLNHGVDEAGSWLGLASPSEWTVGDGAVHVKVADLSGDGLLDIVTANSNSDDISTLVNRGPDELGHWRGFAAVTHSPAGSIPFWVELADLNADGEDELLVANRALHGFYGPVGKPNVGVMERIHLTAFQDDFPERDLNPDNWAAWDYAYLQDLYGRPGFSLWMESPAFVESLEIDLSHQTDATVRFYEGSGWTWSHDILAIEYWDGAVWQILAEERGTEYPEYGWIRRSAALPIDALKAGTKLRLRAVEGNWLIDDVSVVVGLDDCNRNDVVDGYEFAGTSDDCNDNLVPDNCEADCNGNRIADACELASGSAEDCNDNAVPDECDPDCNANERPDACDVATGTSDDCDDNGVPDECEPDCNDNGAPDPCELRDGTAPDCNENGVPDHCDMASNDSDDCNANGVPDECERSGFFAFNSPLLVEVGYDQPRSFTIPSPPAAVGNVVVLLDAAWRFTTDPYLDIDINGTLVRWDFEADGPGCDGSFEPLQMTIPADIYNDAVGGADAVVTVTPPWHSRECVDVLARLRFEYRTAGLADCNSNGTLDECDIASWDSFDCTGDGVPDECEVGRRFATSSRELAPVGRGYPQRLSLDWPPEAEGDVTLAFTGRAARGDLDVHVNEALVGSIRLTTGFSCPVRSETIELTVPSGTYNAAVAGGHAVIRLSADSGVDPFECDSHVTVSIEYQTIGPPDANENGVPDECESSVQVDIRPGSCPNPFSARSRGVVPIAIVGSGAFDVKQIQTGALRLSRADGAGGSIKPVTGPRRIRASIEDVVAPFDAGPCGCRELPADGIDDLVVKFRASELAGLLEPGDRHDDSKPMLTLRGALNDGTYFEGSDCLRLVGRSARSNIGGKR